MKILSLFDGLSCGAIAFKELGHEISRYVAYEIEPQPIKVSTHNFPFIEQRGDVFKADFAEFDGFDWVIGGSPCTYWSIAQKNNRETEASGLGWELFSQYVRAVKEAKPKYFLYENNKSMSKEIRASITETFGFEPVLINSALVSAQNRNRLYWVGKRNNDGTYSKVDVEQPEDQGVLLKDVLDGAVAWQEKSYCITATEYKGSNPWHTLDKHIRTMVAEPVAGRMVGRRINDQGHRDDYNESLDHVQRFEINDDPQKTNCVSTVSKDNAICEPVRVGGFPNAKGEVKGSQGTRIYSIDGKSINLTANGGGQGAKTGLYAIPFENIGEAETIQKAIPEIVRKFGYVPEMFNAYNRSEIIEKSPTLSTGSMSTSSCATCKFEKSEKPIYEVKNGYITIKDKQYKIKLADGYYIIRKLTVSECMRLQTVPAWYDFSVISNTQAYKCLGNGWTVKVIMHLIESALKNQFICEELK